MKKLCALTILLFFISCGKEQIILENTDVEFERFQDAAFLSTVYCSESFSGELEEDAHFPLYKYDCKVIGYKKAREQEIVSPYWLIGRTSVYDDENNLVAEWKYNPKKMCYTDLKFYKTEYGKTYCCIECNGELHERENGYTSSNRIRKRYKLDDNNNVYLYSITNISEKSFEYTMFNPEGNKLRVYIAKAVGDKQEGVDGYYYNMEKVCDEYYHSDGTLMTNADMLFADNDGYVILKSNLYTGMSGVLYLILHPSGDKNEGVAKFIFSKNIHKSYEPDTTYSYRILDDNTIFFYGGYTNKLRREYVSDMTYYIDRDGEIVVKGAYGIMQATFSVAKIKLTHGWLERIFK